MTKKQILVRIDERGQVIIPASVRRALGLRAGDTVTLWMEKGELRITSFRKRLAKAQSLVRKHISADISLADELIAERRKTVKNK